MQTCTRPQHLAIVLCAAARKKRLTMQVSTHMEPVVKRILEQHCENDAFRFWIEFAKDWPSSRLEGRLFGLIDDVARIVRPRAQDDATDETVLMRLMKNSSLAAIKYFVNTSTFQLPSATDSTGWTVQHWLCRMLPSLDESRTEDMFRALGSSLQFGTLTQNGESCLAVRIRCFFFNIFI
jgi:hypothetical protein